MSWSQKKWQLGQLVLWRPRGRVTGAELSIPARVVRLVIDPITGVSGSVSILLEAPAQAADKPGWFPRYPKGCIVSVKPDDLITGPEAIAAFVALRCMGTLVLR